VLIHVDPARQHFEVRDADDLKRFSVVVAGVASSDVGGALAPLGRLESPTHAWVSITQLRAACGRDDDPTWCRAFDEMVQFAAAKGWLDQSGSELRAHLAYEPSAG